MSSRRAVKSGADSLRYIDLFAGCGGLSLGLEKAGFSLEFAVEKSDMAAETFFHNFIHRIDDESDWAAHLELPLADQVRQGLVVKELKALLDDEAILAEIRAKGIDLVAGGPPCQGFSMAGLRNPDDARNDLPWQFLKFVAAVSPRAVLIENVVGISQDFDKHGRPAPFTQLGMQLEQTGEGYVVQRLRLNAQDYGVPQHRPRMMLLALRHDVADAHRLTSTGEVWRSDSSLPTPSLAPVPPARFRSEPRNVADALWDICGTEYVTTTRPPADGDNEYARLMRRDRAWFPPAALDAEEAVPKRPANSRPARHSQKTAQRFALYQFLARFDIPLRVVTVASESPDFEDVKTTIRTKLRAAATSAEAPIFPWVLPGNRVIKSERAVIDIVAELYTKKHSQRPLQAGRPSPTVLTLPDDFVHYIEPRIPTVRELARLQSFPDTFEFRSKETTGSHRRRVEVPQYTQVGNAVPPLMGKAVGELLYELLATKDDAPSRSTAAPALSASH